MNVKMKCNDIHRFSIVHVNLNFNTVSINHILTPWLTHRMPVKSYRNVLMAIILKLFLKNSTFASHATKTLLHRFTAREHHQFNKSLGMRQLRGIQNTELYNYPAWARGTKIAREFPHYRCTSAARASSSSPSGLCVDGTIPRSISPGLFVNVLYVFLRSTCRLVSATMTIGCPRYFATPFFSGPGWGFELLAVRFVRTLVNSDFREAGSPKIRLIGG